jgi:prepilin-type N-terminal cleavage/methylation domain-containing protein
MKRANGFTLVELIVAMTIMVLITTAAVANLRGNSPERQLRDQSRNLASLLRQAQVQAIAGEPADGVVPIGGYGVVIASCSTPPCSAILFADKNGNFALDSGEARQTVSLGAEITVESVSVSDPLNILFRPPAAFICFNNICSGSGAADIVLGARGSTKTTTVSVNQLSGQISSS